MLLKMGLLNLAKPIGIGRQGMCELLRKRKQRTSKKFIGKERRVQRRLGRRGRPRNVAFNIYFFFIKPKP